MSYHAMIEIIAAVERSVGLPDGAIRSRNKAAQYVHARRLAAALILDDFPNATRVEMARALGFRDHSSVVFYRAQIDAQQVRAHADYQTARAAIASRRGVRAQAANGRCVCPTCGAVVRSNTHFAGKSFQ